MQNDIFNIILIRKVDTVYDFIKFLSYIVKLAPIDLKLPHMLSGPIKCDNATCVHSNEYPIINMDVFQILEFRYTRTESPPVSECPLHVNFTYGS